MPLAGFHPIVQSWFAARFGTPTEPQRLGWPAIRSGRDTLVAAPTGSGKTLAAFLAALDDLFRRGFAGKLGDETTVLYVSPLKALSNDVQKNLLGPLDEIRKAAAGEGLRDVEIRVVVRTGDTPARERALIVKRPPHVLVTTLLDSTPRAAEPPPPPQAEIRPPRPSDHAEWIGGYWHFEDRWSWIAGFWRVPKSDLAADLVVRAPSPPPAPRVEVPDAKPARAAVWTAGSWQWDGRAYVWVAGAWRIPPTASHRWRPAGWRTSGAFSVFVPGGWILGR